MELHGEGRFSDRAGLRILAKRLAMRSRSESLAEVRRVVRFLVDGVRVRVPLLFAVDRRLVELFLLVVVDFLGIFVLLGKMTSGSAP